MNIFVLDTDPEKAAEYHCDKHVVKMILETAQLISSAHWVTGNVAPYRLTHKNHPCAIWVRESLDNYKWLFSLFNFLSFEYTKRYKKIHKTWIKFKDIPYPKIESKGLTSFVQAMPKQYQQDDPVQAYRTYYKSEKKEFAKWKYSKKPYWF